MEIKKAVKLLPEQPGIYFMKDSLGSVIYVGKAKNLKARVSQYFQRKKDNSPKVTEMVEHICSFEYITTDTELDAFLLECKTIKELKPKYNSLLKNYKGYMYIKISISEEYPKLSKVTERKRDDALYFGPLTSESSVEKTLQFIKDKYPIRKCSIGAFGRNSSGCLNFHLGACLGPCRGNVIREVYQNCVYNIIQLLNGKDYAPIKELKGKMKLAAINLDFETALKYRDQLKAIRNVINNQRIIKLSQYGRNILAFEKLNELEVKLFLIKGNKLLHTESINLNQNNNISLEEKLRELINTYFKTNKKDKVSCLSQEDIDEAHIIYSYLKRKNNDIQSFNIPLSRIDKISFNKIIEQL